jgi:WS/DGAT/MGAT family acyltransferase
MATIPMSPVDAAWYHMDGPANLAMVTGIALSDQRFDVEAVKTLYVRLSSNFARFRQRVVERGFPIATPCWEDVPGFDLDLHIHHVALPAPHDRAELVRLIDDIASTPLDRRQPLWQVHVVDDVEGGGAMILRYHHCIADGTAMMEVVRHLSDEGSALHGQASGLSAAAGDDDETPAPGGMLDPSLGAIGRAAGKVLSATVDALAHPQELLGRAALALRGTEMLVNELLKRPDPSSPFKGRFGLRKRVAWSQPVAIDDVKAIGAATGAKMNDVLVAALTGALRSYLRRRGVDVDDTSVRAMVPVDLRRPERARRLGNEFGLVILDLPVATRRRKDRLAKTKAGMDALKGSPEAVAILALFNLFGRIPKAIEDLATDLFGSKASVVMTNVVGPRTKLRFAGAPIERMMFWVPHPGRQLGLGVSILSYRGGVTLSVIADARLVPDPETITADFNREVAAMLLQARKDEAAAAPPPKKRQAPRRPAASAPGEAAPVKAAPVKVAPVKTAPVKTAPVKAAPRRARKSPAANRRG